MDEKKCRVFHGCFIGENVLCEQHNCLSFQSVLDRSDTFIFKNLSFLLLYYKLFKK